MAGYYDDPNRPPPGAVPVTLDKRTGAPGVVRGMVGGAPIQDRLAQIRTYYPDAQPYGDDNFVFTDPQTRRPTLYNPPGLDVGDALSLGREAYVGTGATIGAAIPATGAVPTLGGSLATVPVYAGIGGMAGGAVYDAVRGMQGGIDTRTVPERMADSALEFGTNAIGQRLGDLLPEGARVVTKGIQNRTAGVPAVQLLRDFLRLDIGVPSAGQATGSKALQRAEEAAGTTFLGSGIMQRFRSGQLDALTEAGERVAGQFGAGRSQTQAGRALDQGAKTFVDEFQRKANTLYGQVDRHLPETTPVEANAVLQALGAQESAFQYAPNLGAKLTNERLRGYLSALNADLEANGGRIPYNVLKAWRTKIGNDLADPMTVSDVPRAQLKQVYAALTSDMRAAAAEKGAGALQAFDRANRYYAAGLDRVEAVVDDIVKAGTPEQAYTLAMSGARDGGTTLTKLRRTIPPEQWDVVASYTLRRMGEARPADRGADEAATVFSPAKFLTEWNKLSPDARQALFRGTRYADLAPELDALTRVSGALKDTENVVNRSNTAGTANFIGLLQGGGAGVIGAPMTPGSIFAAGLTLVGPATAAKLMTNPNFVRFLANGSRLNNPNSAAALFARMSATLGADPAVREYVNAVGNLQRPTTATEPAR